MSIKGTNLFLLVLAIFIASIGLNINSLPVIIGAMLISPLMGPIMGIGYFVVCNDLMQLKKASIGLIKFVILSLMISIIYFYISPIKIATPEVLNRVNPNIWDACIALLGGIAGVIALTRKEFNNIFPGVAIATSLMPPLCTAGYGFANMQMEICVNALYLFCLNAFFMVLASLVMFSIMQVPEIKVGYKFNWRNTLVALLVIGVLLIPSVQRGQQIIKQEIFEVAVKNLVNEIKKSGTVVLSSEIDKSSQVLSLTLVEDEKMPAEKIKIFTSEYGLNLNIMKRHEKIDLGKLKDQVIEEVLHVTKTHEEENKLKELLSDLRLLDKNIKDINQINERLLIEVVDSSPNSIKKIESFYPLILKRIGKSMNIQIIKVIQTSTQSVAKN